MTNKPKDNPDKVGYDYEKANKECIRLREIVFGCCYDHDDHYEFHEYERLFKILIRQQAFKEVEEFLNEEISECERGMADIKYEKTYRKVLQAIDQLRNKGEK